MNPLLFPPSNNLPDSEPDLAKVYMDRLLTPTMFCKLGWYWL